MKLFSSKVLWSVLGIAVLGGGTYLAISSKQSEKSEVRAMQARFESALQSGESVDLASLLSEDYSDDWGFTEEDLIMVIQDAHGRVGDLGVSLTGGDVDTSADRGVFTTTMRLTGSGDQGWLNDANAIDRPFEIHWKREDDSPTGWRITKISHPEINPPVGWEPGEFAAAE